MIISAILGHASITNKHFQNKWYFWYSNIFINVLFRKQEPCAAVLFVRYRDGRAAASELNWQACSEFQQSVNLSVGSAWTSEDVNNNIKSGFFCITKPWLSALIWPERIEKFLQELLVMMSDSGRSGEVEPSDIAPLWAGEVMESGGYTQKQTHLKPF